MYYLAIFIGLISCIFSMSSIAVDGYKELKFGMTIEQVLNSGICTFDSLTKFVEPDLVEIAPCTDSIWRESVLAEAYFINGEFLRFGIYVRAAADTGAEFNEEFDE